MKTSPPVLVGSVIITGTTQQTAQEAGRLKFWKKLTKNDFVLLLEQKATCLYFWSKI